MKYFKYILRIGLAIGLDMVSKYFFYNLKYLSETTLIRPTFNTGISRSLPVPFIIIIVISIIGIYGFVWLFLTKKISGLIAIMLIAGTTGNLIDRVFLGGVRDFININIFNFPIFNIADTMLCIGVGIRILRVILEKKK